MTSPLSKVGRRLAGGTAEEVCNLIYLPRLLRDFGRIFPALTDVNQAHLIMLRSAGLIEEGPARRIARALVQIEHEGPDAVALDADREDAYFNYEAKLMDLAGADGGRLHAGRSRNDILATTDRMGAREVLLELSSRLAAVEDGALDQAERYASVTMPGYTHLQPAQPITYGFYMAGVAESVSRDAERLSGAWGNTNRCPLGAGALAGTSFPIDRYQTAKLLGFPGLACHALDAVASRDFALEILAAMSIGAVGWSRFAQDFYVWATAEFGLVEFPDGLAGTSSIMPQKKNPVVLEYLKGKGGQLIGLFSAAAATIRGTNFSHAGDTSRESMRSFWEASSECLGALQLLALVLRSAAPKPALMRRRAAEDFSTVTDLADAIVRRTNVSFREAHHVVGAVVRESVLGGLRANQISAEMVGRAFQQVLGRDFVVEPDFVAAALDPERSIAARTTPGGPAPGPLADLIAAGRQRLARARTVQATRAAACLSARVELKREIHALAGLG